MRGAGILAYGGPIQRSRRQAGRHAASLLWRELRARGSRGTVRSVHRAARAWRDRPLSHSGRMPRRRRPARAAWDQQPPSPTRAAWLLLRPRDASTPAEHQLRQRLLAAAPEVEPAARVITGFRRLLYERDASVRVPRLAPAAASPVREVRACAARLREDQAAVRAALDYAWSSGCAEGHIRPINSAERAMSGRAHVDVLRRRVLRAS